VLKIKVVLCRQRTESRNVQRAKEAKKKRYIDSLEQCRIKGGGARGAAAPGPAVLGAGIGGSGNLVIGL